MYDVNKKDAIIASFTSEVERVAEAIKSMYDLKTYIDVRDDSYVRDLLHRLNKSVAGCIPEGVVMDELSVSATISGNVINMIVKTKKVNARIPAKYRKTVVFGDKSTNDSVYYDCVEAIFEAYETHMEATMAQDIVDIINDALKIIVEKANLSYSVRVDNYFGHATNKYIAYMSDNEVIFIVDKEKIFNCGNIAVFREPDMILSEEDINKARTDMAEKFAVAQNVLQFVQNKGFEVIMNICSIPKTKKMSKIVRKSVSKNIMNNPKRTDGLMYYNEGNIYSILEVKDGIVEVVLSPFDLESFRYAEEVDVLSIVNAG